MRRTVEGCEHEPRPRQRVRDALSPHAGVELLELADELAHLIGEAVDGLSEPDERRFAEVVQLVSPASKRVCRDEETTSRFLSGPTAGGL